MMASCIDIWNYTDKHSIVGPSLVGAGRISKTDVCRYDPNMILTMQENVISPILYSLVGVWGGGLDLCWTTWCGGAGSRTTLRPTNQPPSDETSSGSCKYRSSFRSTTGPGYHPHQGSVSPFRIDKSLLTHVQLLQKHTAGSYCCIIWIHTIVSSYMFQLRIRVTFKGLTADSLK